MIFLQCEFSDVFSKYPFPRLTIRAFAIARYWELSRLPRVNQAWVIYKKNICTLKRDRTSDLTIQGPMLYRLSYQCLLKGSAKLLNIKLRLHAENSTETHVTTQALEALRSYFIKELYLLGVPFSANALAQKSHLNDPSRAPEWQSICLFKVQFFVNDLSQNSHLYNFWLDLVCIFLWYFKSLFREYDFSQESHLKVFSPAWIFRWVHKLLYLLYDLSVTFKNFLSTVNVQVSAQIPLFMKDFGTYFTLEIVLFCSIFVFSRLLFIFSHSFQITDDIDLHFMQKNGKLLQQFLFTCYNQPTRNYIRSYIQYFWLPDAAFGKQPKRPRLSQFSNIIWYW